MSVHTIVRNAWIVAGLLVLGVGLGDLVAGRTKLAQYNEALARAPVAAAPDPAVLFPKTTEAQEQRAVALAKLGFYKLLFLAGQILTLTGLVLIMVGVIQLRVRGAPETASPPRSR